MKRTTSSSLGSFKRFAPWVVGALVLGYFLIVAGSVSSGPEAAVVDDVVPAAKQSDHELSPFHMLHSITTDNEMIKFDTLFGKVILVVNVASQCGFTAQYAGLQMLQDLFGEDRFEVFAFPCNQFGQQEPASNEDIAAFARERFHVSFPIMRKSDVNGRDVNMVFRYAKYVAGVKEVRWNFEKFLFDQTGRFVKHYASAVTPEQIQPDIEKLLLQGGKRD
jgi:glutathione peroxidase-family protein